MTTEEAVEYLVERTGVVAYRDWPAKGPAWEASLVRVALRLRDGDPEPQLPPSASMAANALGAVARAAASGFARVDEATKAARLATCEACPQYRPSDGRCGACGCWCSAKAALSQEQCPEGRWPVDAPRAAGDS